MDRLESFATYITINETLPLDTSEEALWYKDNKALYNSGQLPIDKHIAFTTLIRIVDRMTK